MKSISTMRVEIKNIWKVGLILLVTVVTLSCSKEDKPEMEASLLADSSQELILGKWYFSVTSNGDASACETQSYYYFTDTQTLEYQLVIDDFGIGIGVSGYELIGDCYVSPETSINYTLNTANEIQFLNEYGDTITLKIVSINETTLVFTKGTLDETAIYILTKEL